MFFKVIIPVFNSAEYLKGCLDSVITQTFTDWMLFIADDQSTDGADEIVREYAARFPEKIKAFYNSKKRYNGGSRNTLMELSANADALYTLFLDCDDKFTDNRVMEAIHQVATANGLPDCIRLSYNFVTEGGAQTIVLDHRSPQQLVWDQNCASWTKCVKTALFAPFPENTLNEDTTHHLAQCDKIQTVVPLLRACVDWNRANPKSTSRAGSPQRQKWDNALYRCLADVMDLQLETPHCKAAQRAKILQLKQEIMARLRSEGIA